jgi:HSP20 family molecular chaperone IbpA
MEWRDPTISLWDEALGMLGRAERLHRQFFQLEQHGGSPVWEPPVDMFETDGELAIIVALPGVSSADLVVLVDGATLLVRGRRAIPLPPGGGAIRRLEIPYGWFERRITLPPGTYQPKQQTLKDGCLILTLHKLG